MAATILVVDDSATIRNIIKIYLMGMGYEFLETDRAERALQLLKTSPVDLIIADINMPGMDGLEFVRTVRRDPGAIKALPIILLTGEKADEVRAQGEQAGANAFIFKPVTSSNLRESVAKYLPVPQP